MIRSGEEHKIDRYTYPVMENLRRDGFAERFLGENGQKVKETPRENWNGLSGDLRWSLMAGIRDCRLERRGRGGGGDLLHELFYKG